MNKNKTPDAVGIEYIRYMHAYRIYNINKRSNTIAYDERKIEDIIKDLKEKNPDIRIFTMESHHIID